MRDDLEESLRRALRARSPGRKFTERVMGEVERESADSPARQAGALEPTSARGRAKLAVSRRMRPALGRWLPAALAAGLLAAFGVRHLRQESLERERAAAAHAQLLLALGIASEKLDAVRTAVLHEERAGH